MPLETIFDFVLRPMWIILVPVSACWRWCVSATELNSPRELSPRRMQLGYFQVIAEPVSTWVQEIRLRAPRQSPRLVTKLKMPPTPFSSPGYQFCTVEYLMLASSSATSSTTAACNWFSSRIGAVQPSRYETLAPSSAISSVRSNWPVSRALMRKYVESSIGQRTPFGTKTKLPSENTAEFSEAK